MNDKEIWTRFPNTLRGQPDLMQTVQSMINDARKDELEKVSKTLNRGSIHSKEKGFDDAVAYINKRLRA